MKPYRFSLTFAILSSIALLLFLTWFLVSLISFKTAENDLISQKNEEVRILLTSFASIYSTKLPDSEKTDIAEHFAAKLSTEKSFNGLIVINEISRVVFRFKEIGDVDARLNGVLKNGKEFSVISWKEQLISWYAPIIADGKVVGAARLTMSLRDEYARLYRSRQIMFAYFVLDFLLLLGLGSYLLSRFIVVPIKKLLAATEKIADGDLNHRVSVPGGVEIADLAQSFNKMVEALREKRADIDRHVKSLEEINRELQTTRIEALRSEKMASVGLLAAGTAHEIGTPLAAIMGYAGILRDELRDDDAKTDYLTRIEAESMRIDRIVRGLLDYARPAATAADRVDVAVVIAGTLEMLEEQGALKRIRKSLEVGHDLEPVFADRHQLQQVFTNLVLNARDAVGDNGMLTIRVLMGDYKVGPGGVSFRSPGITMGRRKSDFGGAFAALFREDERLVKIEFSDNGTGIDPENLERIFDPFFTTKEPGRGTGLGLAISARIIDSFHGRITVESEKGRGSTFTIWLPVMNEGGLVGNLHDSA
ncbi:MAG TPA: ATP-binding protein [Geobacteraceae bacterium]|nr:ATP-binding protein [Geobacteraceae bacterium]